MYSICWVRLGDQASPKTGNKSDIVRWWAKGPRPMSKPLWTLPMFKINNAGTPIFKDFFVWIWIVWQNKWLFIASFLFPDPPLSFSIRWIWRALIRYLYQKLLLKNIVGSANIGTDKVTLCRQSNQLFKRHFLNRTFPIILIKTWLCDSLEWVIWAKLLSEQFPFYIRENE